jgi:Uma2 family endonuclease
MSPKKSLAELWKELQALPVSKRGEIIEGELYIFDRPRDVHQAVTGAIYADLMNLFQRGRGGPGGWHIRVEPGISQPGSPEFSPDIAGWRRERVPHLPQRIDIAPDWLCEVLSKTTRAHDLRIKRGFYARIGVRWLWYVDPAAHTISVSRLEGGRWLELGVFGDDDAMRAEPFDAVEFALADWWPENNGAGPEEPELDPAPMVEG